jgi:release factor glutamine methyltransferase
MLRAMTVLEVIQRSADFLTRKGVDSPRLQAELLLADVLKLKRMQLYLNFEKILQANELSKYRDLIARRGEREPLQHIVGSTNFCGLEIEVNRSVLVPRPETEILAEKGWIFLGETQKQGAERPTALDLGTGSGCIAIALATKCPQAAILATDVSSEALQIAVRNAERNRVATQIRFVQGDAFAPIPHGTTFDLIISNPPYIASAEIDTLEPEVREFDPRAALDGGSDGLDFYRRIAREAPQFLARAGKCLLEFGDGQAAALREIFEAQNWVVESVAEDYTQRPRIMTVVLK